MKNQDSLMFMNDLESYLTNCNLNGLQTISNEIEIQLGIYFCINSKTASFLQRKRW
jgi:hypothetical protein